MISRLQVSKNRNPVVRAMSVIRAAPLVFNMWLYNRKFKRRKVKSMSSSTQQNGFGPAFLHMMMMKLAQGTAKPKSKHLQLHGAHWAM
jgi:hypothetical protein